MLATYGHEGTSYSTGVLRRIYSDHLKVVEANDPFVSLVEEGANFAGAAANPGQFLVNVFPWRTLRKLDIF